MLIEAPFIVLAVLLPFAEGGQRAESGLHLSVAGLWAAWGIVVKGTWVSLVADRCGDDLGAGVGRWR